MEINELVNLIVNNGFPVAVAAYLLIRLEKQIISLSSSINKLNTIISTKLGVVIDADVSGSVDDSHKVVWEKAINIFEVLHAPNVYCLFILYLLSVLFKY